MRILSIPALVLLIASAIALAACGSADDRSNSLPSNADAAGTTEAHMQNTTFTQSSVSIRSGQSLTLVADTFVPHVIANGTWVGAEAQPGREQGAPEVRDLNIPGNRSGTIGPFTRPGTFLFYCTLHPNMNLTVVVE